MPDVSDESQRSTRSIEVAGTLSGGKLHMVGDEGDTAIQLSIVVDENGSASGTMEITQDNESSPSVLPHDPEMFGTRRIGPEFRGAFAGRAGLGFGRGMAAIGRPINPFSAQVFGGRRGGVAGGSLRPGIFRQVFQGWTMGPHGQVIGGDRPDSRNGTVEIFFKR